MIRILIGDVLESKAQTLVNTVNCVGVMGKGVALEFRKRFPDMYRDYLARCAGGQVRLGRPYLYRNLLTPWILNFPTKDHWRSVSRVSDIEEGLSYLVQHYREWGITSLALPPLGCGQGGLEWSVVGPILYRHVRQLGIPAELYAPYGTPQSQLEVEFLAQAASGPEIGTQPKPASALSPAWVALVTVVERIQREPYHWPVGRTIFQKIAYFATESGLPTGLRYVKGSYGPFASELKSVITQLVNTGVVREEQIGKMFAMKPGPAYPDAAELFRSELGKWEPIIERVTDLFLRMTTRQAEVAATVYFVALSLTREGKGKPSEGAVFEEVKRWKQKRRPTLADEEIARTTRSLNVLRWIDVHPSKDLPVPEDELAYA